MASVTITWPANTGATNSAYETGAQLRHMSRMIAKAAAALPDKCSSGADVTLVIDNTASGTSPGFITLAGGPLPASVTYRI